MSTTNSYVRPKLQKQVPVKTYTGSADAIDITAGDVHVLNRTGAVNSATLADPDTVKDEGRVIWIINGTTQANTVTITNGLGGSGGSYDLMTFAAAKAANMMLRAYQGSWYLVGQYGVTVS